MTSCREHANGDISFLNNVAAMMFNAQDIGYIRVIILPRKRQENDEKRRGQQIRPLPPLH